VKNKLCIFILLFFLTNLFVPILFAEEKAVEKSDIKQSIVFIYSNNMGKTDLWKSYENDIKTEIQKRFNKTFANNYNVIIGDEYLKKMNDAGMTDLSTAERADILGYFKDNDIDYIVIFETLPMNKENNSFGILFSMSWTSFSHLKFIDVKQNKYLYNGKFSYRSQWASVFGHYTKNYQDAEEQVLIPKLLPQSK
jgi:hypothetical protein